MDYPTNGSNAGGAKTAPNDIGETDVAARMRGYAEDATENFNDVVKKGRDMVLKYPVLSVAGAVAAGYLFARLFARRK